MFPEEPDQQRRGEGILPLVIWDATGQGPSPQQVVSFQHLRVHEPEVFRAVMEALFQCYQEATASPISGFWDWFGSWFGIKPIESPEGLATEAGFLGLEITREHVGGSAHILFNVDSDLDPEHGMMIVYHKDRPATVTSVDALELESGASVE